MSGIIRAPRRNTHDQLPRAALRDKSLSYRARGILARLLTNADGFSMTAHDLAAEGCEGRAAVLNALKELRAAGYVRTIRKQKERGRWSTETFVYETPQPPTEVQFPNSGGPNFGEPNPGDPDSGAPEVGGPEPGEPKVGAPDPKSRQKPSSRKSSSSKAEAVPAAAPVDETAQITAGNDTTGQPGRKRLRTHAPTGAVYWLDDEPSELDTLVEVFGLAEVRKAVAALVEKGTDPLHGRLRAFLLSQRRAAAEADAMASRRRETTEEERAEDARRAREAIAAFKAGRDAPEPPRHRDTRTMEQILIEQFGVKTA